MHQKDLVREVWGAAGLYRTRDAKLKQFLERVDQASTECWPELARALREDYAEYLEEVVLPLWNSGDTLLRLNLIRLIDPDRPDELALMNKLARKLDPRRDLEEIRTLAAHADDRVLDAVARRKGLPAPLHDLVTARRAARRP